MKVIDTFPFNKDFITLEIRLNELWEIVDKFIISESIFSHSGELKPLYLKENNEILEKYKDKLILISSLKKLRTKNARVRELYQRGLIDKELKKISFNHDDFIIHSDCDEIPRASTIKNLVNNRAKGRFILELDNYSYYLNAYAGKWNRCTVSSYEHFKGVLQARQNIFKSEAREMQRIKLPILRVPDFFATRKGLLRFLPVINNSPNLILIENAGWHFNNLMPEKDLILKVKSSSHTELVSENLTDFNYISNLRKNALDLYTEKKLIKIAINDSYPTYVVQNLHKYKDFIYI